MAVEKKGITVKIDVEEAEDEESEDEDLNDDEGGSEVQGMAMGV